jgi:hypothetical protein
LALRLSIFFNLFSSAFARRSFLLVDLSLWGTSIIGLAVQCPDGKYFGSIRAPSNVYDHVLEFLKRSHGQKLREVMDAEIDISDVIQ